MIRPFLANNAPTPAAAPRLVRDDEAQSAGYRGPRPWTEHRSEPTVSIVVIVGDDTAVPTDRLIQRLPRAVDREVDLVVAFAGVPADAAVIKRARRDARVVLAPPGTSTQELRALAMREAGGDIVTLINGADLADEPSEPLASAGGSGI